MVQAKIKKKRGENLEKKISFLKKNAVFWLGIFLVILSIFLSSSIPFERFKAEILNAEEAPAPEKEGIPQEAVEAEPVSDSPPANEEPASDLSPTAEEPASDLSPTAEEPASEDSVQPPASLQEIPPDPSAVSEDGGIEENPEKIPEETVQEPGQEGEILPPGEIPEENIDDSVTQDTVINEETEDLIDPEEIVEFIPNTDDPSDKTSLAEGILMPQQFNIPQVSREGGVKLAEISIAGKSEGEVISLNEALETILSVTTHEEDLEKAILRSILKKEETSIKEAISEDRPTLKQIEAVDNTSLFESVNSQLEDVMHSGEFQKVIAETLEDDGQVEILLSRIMNDETKNDILEQTVKASLSGETSGILAEDIISEVISDDSDRFNLESILIQKLISDPATQDKLLDTFQVEDLNEKKAIQDPLINVRVTGNGENLNIPLENIHFEAGALTMVLDLPRDFLPGTYQANVELINPITGAKDMIVQDFLWGVLAFNTDKDNYRSGDEARVEIGVLDDKGKPVCDAQVTLDIISPDGSSASAIVKNTDNCLILSSSNIEPDYLATYTFTDLGDYTLKTTATLANGKSRFSFSKITVKQRPSFTVERQAATRLYPVGFAPMKIRMHFDKSFSGTFTDVLPASFDLSEISPSSSGEAAKINLSDDGRLKKVSWQLEAKAGEIKNFSYLYDAPDISPEFYTIGPVEIKEAEANQTTYLEQRSWQIANDEPIIDADSTANLRLNWQFNTGSGTTATDSSANGNNGTLTLMEAGDWTTNTPLTTNQNLYALDFDGVNEFVTVADPASGVLDFNDTADFSITGWFNRDTFTTDDNLVAKSAGQLAANTGYNIYIDDATDKLVLDVADGVDLYTITSASSFTSTGWNHFTVIWDQDNAANSEIYINGADDNAVDVGTIGNIGTLANALAFRVGAESDNGNPFDGKIDDVRVYNKVLSQSEISILSEGNKPGAAVGLSLWLKADAGITLSGTDVTSWVDQSGNNHNFAQGTTANQPDKITSTVNFNPVISFDGINDVLTASTFLFYPYHIFSVLRNPDTGANQRTFFGTNTPDGPDYSSAMKANDTSGNAVSSYFLGGSAVSAETPSLDNEFYLHTGLLGNRDSTSYLDINAKNMASSTPVSGSFASVTQAAVGSGYTSGTTLSGYFQGDLSELIVYSGEMSNTEKQKIESYLGIKYGLTLDQTALGGGLDYLNSDGNTIWIADASDIFEHDIAGIAQDDASRLDQVKSKSVNTDAILTVGDANSQGNLDSMTWANNNGAATWTSTGAPAGYKILSRQWRTLESIGDIGTVDLEFDIDDTDFNVPVRQGGTGYYFIYDSDDDGLLSDETPTLMKDDGTTGDDTTSDAKWTKQINFASDAGGGGATREFTIVTFVAPSPAVTDNYISVNSGSGTSGAFIVGDQVIVSWNNNGDNNTGLTAITADLSGWGGSSTTPMTDTSDCFGIAGNNLYEACYTLTVGSIDAINVNTSVTATNLGGSTTTADTSNSTVDNQPPTVTTSAISVTGSSGTAGTFKSGDAPSGRWNDSATGDNNADTISSVRFNLANFRSDNTNLAGSNVSDIWTAALSGPLDAQGDTNNNTTVTVTDNAGNQTVTAGTNNYTVDTYIPEITSITSVAGDTSPPYVDLTNNSNTPIIFTSTDVGTGISSCRFNPTDVAFGSMGFVCASATNCTPFIAGEGSKTVYLSCIDGAGNTTSPNTQVDYTVDGTGPTGVSITPASTRIITDDFPTFVVNDGTDTISGIDTSTRLLERREGTYSSNSCGQFGDYSTIVFTGTYPNISDQTASGSKCYQYRWSVSDNVGNSSNAVSSTITRVPFTTLVITQGDNQSYGATDNPMGYLLPTSLQVQVTDGGTNTALTDEITVDFTITATPLSPVATGQSLSAASDNTDANGHAEVTFTLGDRAGLYQVEASSTHVSIGNTVTFDLTEIDYLNFVVTETTALIALDPISNPLDGTSPTINITTNAAEFEIHLTPDQWPTSGLNKILNWVSPLGFGWSLNAGAITPFLENLGDPDSTLVYSCTGNDCQGSALVDIDLNAGIDFNNAPGSYENTIEFKAENIVY